MLGYCTVGFLTVFRCELVTLKRDFRCVNVCFRCWNRLHHPCDPTQDKQFGEWILHRKLYTVNSLYYKSVLFTRMLQNLIKMCSVPKTQVAQLTLTSMERNCDFLNIDYNKYILNFFMLQN